MFRLNPELNAVVAPNAPIEPRWTARIGSTISSSPTVYRTTLLVSGNDGLYGFDVFTGRVCWKIATPEPVMSAAVYSGNIVVVGQGGRDSRFDNSPYYVVVGGAGENAMLGVDLNALTLHWGFAIDGTGMPTAIIVHGVALHHDGSGEIVALNAHSGQYLWRENVGASASMTAINVLGPRAVVTAGMYKNEVVAFDPSDGRILWRTSFSDNCSGFGDGPVAVAAGRVFGQYLAPLPTPKAAVGSAAARQHVYALDARTGRLLWDRAEESGVVPRWDQAAIPMAHGNAVFIGSAIAPYVLALDVVTGRLRWRTRVGGPVKGSSVLSAGVVYFGDLAGDLWALDARSGVVVGRKRMPDAFNVGSPIIVGRSLLIGSRNGYVFALPLREIRESRDPLHD